MITASGKSMRNVVEAVLFFLFFVLIFAFLPISFKVKVILIILTGGPAAIFGFIGINKCSVTEYLGLMLRYRSKEHEFKREDMFEEFKPKIEDYDCFELK